MSRKVIQAKVLGHVLLWGRWGGLRELMLPRVESCSTEETEGWFPGVLGNIMESLVTQMIKNLPTMQETGFNPWIRKIPGEGNSNPLQ